MSGDLASAGSTARRSATRLPELTTDLETDEQVAILSGTDSDAVGKAAAGIDLALVHYPVFNRRNERTGSAVTNLDLHDIARTAKTYGVGTYYVVTPYADQQKLVGDILAHWLTGHGGIANPARREALSLVEVVSDLDDLVERVMARRGRRPIIMATTAKTPPGAAGVVGCDQVRLRLLNGEPHLLLFGTAWGLADDVFDGVDGVLESICGAGGYNHLPVRAAVAIFMDRLLGCSRDFMGGDGLIRRGLAG